jgi:hypothetical protein
MFNLTASDLKLKILGCADGPASFNSFLTKQKGKIISVDPIYQFSADEIEKRIEETKKDIMEQMDKNKDEYIWDKIKSVSQLAEIRMNAMRDFLGDFEAGKKQNRYVTGELPQLPFENHSFDLALCSHFLFLFSDHFSYDYHINSIKELCRIANETRIFPLQTLAGKPSPYIKPIMKELEAHGYAVTILKIDYEFQRGANQMLLIESNKTGPV